MGESVFVSCTFPPITNYTISPGLPDSPDNQKKLFHLVRARRLFGWKCHLVSTRDGMLGLPTLPAPRGLTVGTLPP